MMGDINSNSVSYSVNCSLMMRAGIYPSISEADIKHVGTLAAYREKFLLINNILANPQDFILQ